MVVVSFAFAALLLSICDTSPVVVVLCSNFCVLNRYYIMYFSSSCN